MRPIHFLALIYSLAIIGFVVLWITGHGVGAIILLVVPLVARYEIVGIR